MILEVNGEHVDDTRRVVDAVVETARAASRSSSSYAATASAPSVSVTPREVEDGRPQVGIQLGTQPDADFPVDVTINIDPGIGGPSAGLMFSPRHLRHPDAGLADRRRDRSPAPAPSTPPATVGPIGGIQQKIVGARDAGAELFLVPPDNCDEAVGAPNDDMRLVEAPTMHSARRVRSRPGSRTRTPTCPPVETTRHERRMTEFELPEPATWTRRWPPRSSRSRATSPPTGWDQPARLYALVDTAALVQREPALAAAMGLDYASARRAR